MAVAALLRLIIERISPALISPVTRRLPIPAPWAWNFHVRGVPAGVRRGSGRASPGTAELEECVKA